MTDYFAYVHARPSTTSAEEIFYVGKGNMRRAKSVKNPNRSAHHQNVVSKHGRNNILVGVIPCSTEEIAYDLERGLIKCLRRMGVSLVNKTEGGDGAVSQEVKDRIAASKRGVKHSAETRAKMSVSQKLRMNTEQSKKRASERMTARMADPEARKKLSDATKSQWARQREMSASKQRLFSTTARIGIGQPVKSAS